MWRRLKRLISRPQEPTAGKPEAGRPALGAQHPCYAVRDEVSRWQGDIYAASSFPEGVLPAGADKIPYWMLANRTCQLVEGNGRSVKLPHLVYCAVITLRTYVSGPGATPKNRISNVVNGKDDLAGFLPPSEEYGIREPLVVNFNLVWSASVASTPNAAHKVAQLSSPFAEHVFQRFSRWFYTVGYDDEQFKTKTYVEELLQSVSD
jgi:hypothetical protein